MIDAASLSVEQGEILDDLCSCPGLFAGQYLNLERLPAELVVRRYEGAAGFMGLAKAWPTDLGLAIWEARA